MLLFTKKVESSSFPNVLDPKNPDLAQLAEPYET